MQSQSIQNIDSITSCEHLGQPLHLSSLFYTPNTFPVFCHIFLKENQIFGPIYDEIIKLQDFQENSNEMKDDYVNSLVKWVQSFEGKIQDLDKITYKILHVKILGMILLVASRFDYEQFEEVIRFFYNSLKFQKFSELKQEFSDILFILLQNFFLILQNKTEKTKLFNAELLLIKSLNFLTVRSYQEFSHDFAPIFIKIFCAINENCCCELFFDGEKEKSEFQIRKMNALLILKKSIKLFHFFIFLNKPDNEQIFEDSHETYENLFGSCLYLIILENKEFFEKNFKKFKEFNSIEELTLQSAEKNQDTLAFEILKRELQICSNNEKNILYEDKTEIQFLKIFEGLFQVI